MHRIPIHDLYNGLGRFMRRLYCSMIAVLSFFGALAQDNLHYQQLDFGAFNVGFHDTLLLHEDIVYNNASYNGSMPIIIKVWHPVSNTNSAKTLLLKDFQSDAQLPQEIAQIEANLNEKFDDYYRKYFLLEDYIHFDQIDYSPLSDALVLESIKNTPTKSVKAAIDPNSEFPVIVYHHGSRGISYDNYVMAEYLASHGYIVVSANYNFPYDKQPYGFSKQGPYDAKLAERVIDFSNAINQSSKIAYVGHSWGAQLGFAFLPNNDLVDAFVSMETTLELWNKTQVRKKWKRLSKLIEKNTSGYEMPILMFANQGDESPVSFDFFKAINADNIIFSSSKKEFVHESYASYYSMRLMYNHVYPQHDSEEFAGQVEIYGKNLKLIKSFLDQTLQYKDVEYDSFYEDFYMEFKKSDDELGNSPLAISPN